MKKHTREEDFPKNPDHLPNPPVGYTCPAHIDFYLRKLKSTGSNSNEVVVRNENVGMHDNAQIGSSSVYMNDNSLQMTHYSNSGVNNMNMNDSMHSMGMYSRSNSYPERPSQFPSNSYYPSHGPNLESIPFNMSQNSGHVPNNMFIDSRQLSMGSYSGGSSLPSVSMPMEAPSNLRDAFASSPMTRSQQSTTQPEPHVESIPVYSIANKKGNKSSGQNKRAGRSDASDIARFANDPQNFYNISSLGGNSNTFNRGESSQNSNQNGILDENTNDIVESYFGGNSKKRKQTESNPKRKPASKRSAKEKPQAALDVNENSSAGISQSIYHQVGRTSSTTVPPKAKAAPKPAVVVPEPSELEVSDSLLGMSRSGYQSQYSMPEGEDSLMFQGLINEASFM